MTIPETAAISVAASVLYSALHYIGAAKFTPVEPATAGLYGGILGLVHILSISILARARGRFQESKIPQAFFIGLPIAALIAFKATNLLGSALPLGAVAGLTLAGTLGGVLVIAAYAVAILAIGAIIGGCCFGCCVCCCGGAPAFLVGVTAGLTARLGR